MICSICNKNLAVVFTNKIINGKTEMKGMCIPCAKKQGISPINKMLENFQMNPEDLENLNEQLMDVFEDVNVEEFPSEDIPNKENPFIKFPGDFLSKVMNFKPKEETPPPNEEKKTIQKKKFLDTYGINLTDKAKNNGVDKVVGRQTEINRIIQILNRRNKNNPILIGEPGVGKTALAEGLAVRIAQKQVPTKLYDTEVYLLDLTAIVAGTQFRGQFESRMKSIIDETKKLGNIILIIDEVHNIIGAGSAESGTMNAANILKPALAKGEIQVIGATTIEEYRKHIEKDSALERRFQPVFVEEPSSEETIEILKEIKEYYEKHHNVIISDSVIEATVSLSERYISDRFLPDKAIDVIDEAGSLCNLKNETLVEISKTKEDLQKIQEEIESCASKNDYEKAAQYKIEECKLQEKLEKLEETSTTIHMTIEDIAFVIESWTKIPVQKITEIEAKKLLELEERLHKKVIGQDKAVMSLAKTIRRNRSGFKKHKKPSSFIFVGPTGVGKTELVKTLALELFENEKAFIRIDMSEYMEKHTVSKLIGAPPGYVGYNEGGQLTEKVRRNPYSVILLDEIEKAHPDVFNMLLQILEDGRLTDSQGRTVHFENTILIMTSNAGTNLKSNGMGFEKNNYTALESKAQDALREVFRPEFLNRIDEIIVFTELNKEELKQIVDLMLNEIVEEAKEKEMILKIHEDVKDFIVEKGYDPKYGARPLRRTIQKYIEDEIAELFLKGRYKNGDSIKISLKDEEIIFE